MGNTVILLGVVLAGFIGLAWWVQRMITSHLSPSAQQAQLEQLIQQLYGSASDQLSLRNKEILQNERQAIQQDLSHRQQLFERMVQELRTDLNTRQQALQTAEQDRAKQFGELTAALDTQRQLSEQVKTSTEQLARVLSNNQMRGGWGERIIESLLTSNGLVEGIHYQRQKAQQDTALRPDITLLLPNDRNVPVDVKFPYAEIQKMANAENKVQQDIHVKQFAQDLKGKIQKVAQYIDPSQKTVEYAILFVPNEMVFSFINQKFPELIDQAIQQRVLIVSPFTFLIVARTVLESYRNFMIEDKLRDMLVHIQQFTVEWDKYQEELAKLGRSLDSVRNSYEQLQGTRTKQLTKRIERIRKIEKTGALKAVASSAPQPTLLEDDGEIV